MFFGISLARYKSAFILKKEKLTVKFSAIAKVLKGGDKLLNVNFLFQSADNLSISFRNSLRNK